MSSFRNIERIKAQIVDTERLFELVKDHPIMANGLLEKLADLKNQLKKIPKQIIEPKIRLLFSGGAVKGALGIKSSFIGKTVHPFQEMIKTQSALVRFGSVAKRGRAKKSISTELYITALPIGSFGVELSKLESEDLFAEHDVAYAMQQIMELVKHTSESDIIFEDSIKKMPKRNLSNLKKFLKEIAEEHSFLKMESGELSIEISDHDVQEAYNRVSATTEEESQIFVDGILRGILLDSGKFEIQDTDGAKISGFISEELGEEELIQFDREFLNKECRIHLRISKIKFKTGNENTDYELLGMQ